MSESKFKKMTMIMPLVFAMLFVTAILFPVAMLIFAVSQVGMPPKAIAIFVASLAVTLDVVALLKWHATPEIKNRRWHWFLLVLLVPYLGSSFFLLKRFRLD